MRQKKIKATFIGIDSRLEVGHHYDIDMLGNLATIHRDGRSDVICPYDTICAFLTNWCNIEIEGVKVPKNYKLRTDKTDDCYKASFLWWNNLPDPQNQALMKKYYGNKIVISDEDVLEMWRGECGGVLEGEDDECIIGA